MHILLYFLLHQCVAKTRNVMKNGMLLTASFYPYDHKVATIKEHRQMALFNMHFRLGRFPHPPCHICVHFIDSLTKNGSMFHLDIH